MCLLCQWQGADTFRGLLQVTDKHTMLSKQILHPTSGMVVPGELMALVGPSGAGEHDLPLTSLCLPLVHSANIRDSMHLCKHILGRGPSEESSCCAGKSTLLDILSLRKSGKLSGQVNVAACLSSAINAVRAASIHVHLPHQQMRPVAFVQAYWKSVAFAK